MEQHRIRGDASSRDLRVLFASSACPRTSSASIGTTNRRWATPQTCLKSISLGHLIARYQPLIDEYPPKEGVFGVEWSRLAPNDGTAQKSLSS
jgi:hypothetical protein